MFNLHTLEMFEGDLPSKEQETVKEWMIIHQDELLTMWKEQIIKKLPPLKNKNMIIRIKDIKLLNNYNLLILFDDNKQVIYDMNNDIETLPNYDYLKKKKGLWEQVKLDKSRTCVYWNDLIDLPSDILYEYGKEI